MTRAGVLPGVDDEKSLRHRSIIRGAGGTLPGGMMSRG
jgi:hypothetical protein